MYSILINIFCKDGEEDFCRLFLHKKFNMYTQYVHDYTTGSKEINHNSVAITDNK